MKTTRLSASDLKRNTAEVLNMVAFGHTVAIVERHGQPLVKITPATSVKKKIDETEIKKKLDKYFGVIPDFPDVTRARYSRKRRLKL